MGTDHQLRRARRERFRRARRERTRRAKRSLFSPTHPIEVDFDCAKLAVANRYFPAFPLFLDGASAACGRLARFVVSLQDHGIVVQEITVHGKTGQVVKGLLNPKISGDQDCKDLMMRVDVYLGQRLVASNQAPIRSVTMRYLGTQHIEDKCGVHERMLVATQIKGTKARVCVFHADVPAAQIKKLLDFLLATNTYGETGVRDEEHDFFIPEGRFICVEFATARIPSVLDVLQETFANVEVIFSIGDVEQADNTVAIRNKMKRLNIKEFNAELIAIHWATTNPRTTKAICSVNLHGEFDAVCETVTFPAIIVKIDPQNTTICVVSENFQVPHKWTLGNMFERYPLAVDEGDEFVNAPQDNHREPPTEPSPCQSLLGILAEKMKFANHIAAPVIFIGDITESRSLREALVSANEFALNLLFVRQAAFLPCIGVALRFAPQCYDPVDSLHFFDSLLLQ